MSIILFYFIIYFGLLPKIPCMVLYKFRIVILFCSNYTIYLIIVLHFRTAGNITNVVVPMCSIDPFNSANESFDEEKYSNQQDEALNDNTTIHNDKQKNNDEITNCQVS